jgi:hypothetical protein
MKTLFFIFFGFSVLMGSALELKLPEVDSNVVYGSEQFKVNQVYYASIVSFDIIDMDFNKDFHLSIESILEVVVVFLICCALLGVLLTPLLLLYSWVYYSFIYVNQFRDKFSIKKWITGKSGLDFESFSKLIWMNYRETYSKMIGFGLAIVAYTVSSNMYMYKNFNKIEDALFDYFSFPFKVLDNFNLISVSAQNEGVPSELWQEMYLIVGISFLVFFIGYFIGRLVVSLRYDKLKKEWQHEQGLTPLNKIIILE